MSVLDPLRVAQRPIRRIGRAAFSLVELMIVVVIIGLLATVAIPAAQRAQQRSFTSRFINDFRQFESAFQHYAAENGQWPPPTPPGIVPVGMDSYLPAAFTNTSPLGGNYQWSGPSHYVVLRTSQAIDEIMQLVDAALDDGNLATGQFIAVAGVGYGYHAP